MLHYGENAVGVFCQLCNRHQKLSKRFQRENGCGLFQHDTCSSRGCWRQAAAARRAVAGRGRGWQAGRAVGRLGLPREAFKCNAQCCDQDSVQAANSSHLVLGLYWQAKLQTWALKMQTSKLSSLVAV